MSEKILFLTGKLAKRQLERILNSMKPEFSYLIFDKCGQSVQIDKKFKTAKAILNFAY